MPVDYMIMAIKIQHADTNELYGFADINQEQLHEGLIKARNLKEGLKFKHYSLLCHLILHQNMIG